MASMASANLSANRGERRGIVENNRFAEFLLGLQLGNNLFNLGIFRAGPSGGSSGTTIALFHLLCVPERRWQIWAVFLYPEPLHAVEPRYRGDRTD
jgi:hypothetical protein